MLSAFLIACKHALTFPIPKRDDPSNSYSYRPTSPILVILKVFGTVISGQLCPFLERGGLLRIANMVFDLVVQRAISMSLRSSFLGKQPISVLVDWVLSQLFPAAGLLQGSVLAPTSYFTHHWPCPLPPTESILLLMTPFSIVLFLNALPPCKRQHRSCLLCRRYTLKLRS